MQNRLLGDATAAHLATGLNEDHQYIAAARAACVIFVQADGCPKQITVWKGRKSSCTFLPPRSWFLEGDARATWPGI